MLTLIRRLWKRRKTAVKLTELERDWMFLVLANPTAHPRKDVRRMRQLLRQEARRIKEEVPATLRTGHQQFTVNADRRLPK